MLPLHEKLRGRKTIDYYRELRANELLSPQQIEAIRAAKLREVITHCLEQVPFWRDRLRAAGIEDARDVNGIGDLAVLPPLERDDIRDHLDDMLARDWRDRLIRYSTGGSTGHPLVFYTETIKEAWHNAHKLRTRAWHGVLPGDRQADFWGSPIELDRQSRLRIAKDRWLLNQVILSAFDLTDQRLDEYAAFLARFRPQLVYGYPTVIYRLAEYLDGRERKVFGDWHPHLVSCTSEMLHDHQRELIGKVFGCPVANEYGSRDGGLISHECPAGRMHIAAEHVYVEVDQPDENGIGDLLITNLDAHGMPLLRYRVGDRAALTDPNERCSCGLPLPMMQAPAGRSNDFLVGAGGKLIHSLAPIYILREIPKIRQFKLIQHADHSLNLKVVSAESFSDAELEDIREGLRKILGEPVSVDIEFVETIAPEKSGKYRWVVSEAAAS